jgi:DNA-binding GntR family transcriptional regulator
MTLQDDIKLETLGNLPIYLPLREVVYQSLKNAILTGELKPGQQLSENLIANKLSVSRTPVREALRSLENENLVSVLSGRKVIVSVPTIQEIEEIYDIRLIVETEALRRITPDESAIIQQLEACIKMAEVHLENENLGELHKTNSEFHLTIISALQNNKMKQFLDSLQDTMSRYRFYSLTSRVWARSSEDEHSQILNQLKQGDTESAVRILRQHLTTAKAIVKAMF